LTWIYNLFQCNANVVQFLGEKGAKTVNWLKINLISQDILKRSKGVATSVDNWTTCFVCAKGDRSGSLYSLLLLFLITI